MAKDILTLPKQGIAQDSNMIRLCPLSVTQGKPLYCSRDGHFYNRYGREIRYHFSPYNRTPGRGCHNKKRGLQYPDMTGFGSIKCHLLIAVTWIGPRPEGYECDHINGDIMNWSADNLEWVTPAENRRRASILRKLRAYGYDPKTFMRDDLIYLFNHSLTSKK